MVFWKRELRDLAASQRRFEDIFRIFTAEFTDTPFSEQYRAGRTLRMSYGELAALSQRIARVLHARFSGKEGAFLAAFLPEESCRRQNPSLQEVKK